MISIYDKEMIMQAFDAARQKGVKHPEKEAQDMRGFFRGCTFKSKWGESRVQQKWTLLVSTAPALMKKHCEVPNCLRRILHIKTLKHSVNKSTPTDQTLEQIHLPAPLQMIVEDMVMERILQGEEVNMQCVKSILVFATELWNTITASMRETLHDQTLRLIKEQDQALAVLSADELATKVDGVIDSALAMLRPIRIAENDATLL